MAGRNANSTDEEFYDFNRSVTRHRLVSQDSYSEEKEEEEIANNLNAEDTKETSQIQDDDDDGEDHDLDEARENDPQRALDRLRRRREARDRFDAKVRRGLEGVKAKAALVSVVYIFAVILAMVCGALVVDRSMEESGDLFLWAFAAGVVVALVATALLLGDTRANGEEVDSDDDESKEPLKSILGPEGMDTEHESADTCCDCLGDALVYLLQINQNALKVLVMLWAGFIVSIAIRQVQELPATAVEANGLLTAAFGFAVVALGFVLMDFIVYCFYHDEIGLVRGMRSTESPFEEITDTAEVIMEMPNMHVFADENRAYLRAATPRFYFFVNPLANKGLLFAVVCSDVASLLLLSKVLVGVSLRREDLVVLVLLFANAVIWELLSCSASLFESYEAREAMAELSEAEFEVEEKLISTTSWLRTTFQSYADMHSLIIGLLVIPLITTLSLLSTGQIEHDDLLLVLVPFVGLFGVGVLLECWSFRLLSCCSVLLSLSAFISGHLRLCHLFPRILSTLYAAALIVIELEAPEAGSGVPPYVHIIHAVYLFVPLLLRFVLDISRSRGLTRTVKGGMQKNEVDFSGRSLTGADILYITQALSTSPSEQEHLALRFQDVYPSLSALRLLTHSLKHQKKTGGIFLDVSLNHIGVKGAKNLGRFLKSSKSSRVRGLGLGGNQIGSEGAKAIANGMKNSTALETLFLEYNDIGNDGVEAIAQALEENHTLKALFSVGNKIGDSGAGALANALEMNETVAVLGLDQNQIGPDGALNLVTALAHNYSLRSLSLNENLIRAEGAQALRRGLAENKSLTELHLSNNQIGDEGAIALGEGLRNNSTLLSFTLSKNKIGDEGAVGLGLGLKENQALTDLNLNENIIGPSGARHLGEALESNTALRTLSLENNRIFGNVRQLLQDAVPRMKM